MSVSYRISWPAPGSHVFEVTCEIASPDSAGQRFSLPAWIPGSYMIREFAKNVVQLEATANGASVKTEKIDKSTWCADPCEGPLNIRYQVYAWDLSVRTAHLDNTHAYFNGTSVFLCVQGQESAACELVVENGPDECCKDWKVYTGLKASTIDQAGFGSYIAANYQELVDCPVEVGDHTATEFGAGGVPHQIVISGQHAADMDRLCRDLKIICEHHIRFFGEPAPMDRYVFLTWVVGEGYGGLEHRNSTSLLCSRKDLPRVGESSVTDEYRNFLGLCSHEYFHTWNVKRIRPLAFAETQLDEEAYTRQLWIFEGITSYYDDLSLVRTGLVSPESYLELIGQNLTRLQRCAGRHKQSVAESSFEAWTKFYKQDENAPNAIVSYYTKGAAIALLLDLTIRVRTDGAKSLDDVMDRLWNDHGKVDKPLTEGEVEQLVSDVTGQDFAEFFDHAIRSCEELPLPEALAHVGVDWQLRAALDANDKGGKAAENLPAVWLGARLVPEGTQLNVTHVFDHGPAQQAGLSAGDKIVALDNLQASAALLASRMKYAQPGDVLQVHAFRRDELMEYSIPLEEAPADTVVLTLNDQADAAMLARRVSWLQVADTEA